MSPRNHMGSGPDEYCKPDQQKYQKQLSTPDLVRTLGTGATEQKNAKKRIQSISKSAEQNGYPARSNSIRKR